MSELAKNARKAMHAKIKRITKNDSDNSKHQIDASDFVGYPDLNSTAKTGARPISRRQFKKGGKVVKMHGEHAKHHAGRKARKSGGKALTANSLINRNVREANEEREGIKHIGAFKKGGKVHRKHREDGGFDIANKAMAAEAARRAANVAAAKSAPAPQPMTRDWGPQGEPTGKSGPIVTNDGKKHGGKIHKADGGSFVPTSRMAFSGGESRMSKAAGLNKGGRAHKMGGGMMGPSKAMNAPPKGLRGVLGLGRKHGGEVHSDVTEDKKLIKKAFRQHENSEHGGKHSELHLKKGGYAKKAGGGSSGSSIAGGGSSITGGYSGMTDAEVSGRKAGMEDYPRIKRVQDAAVQPLRAIRQATDYIGEKYGDLRDSTRSVLSGDPDDEEFRKGQRDVRNNILGYKKGGKVSSASKRGGSMSVSDGSLEGTRPVGGRLARKHGGNAGKGKMNVNIIIAQKPEGAALGSPMAHPPMPMPPPGMPPGGMPPGAGGGMPPGMPPMPPPGAPGPMGMPPGIIGRKSGGKVGHRSYKSVKDMDAGAGGGEGRMEKLKIYGLKPSQTTKNY